MGLLARWGGAGLWVVLVGLLAGAAAKPAPRAAVLDGALKADALGGAVEAVFVARNVGEDPHWYANFGYWSDDTAKTMYGPPGARLAVLDLRTRKVARTLVDDPRGSIRDATVHHDGRTILFAWRKCDSRFFNLYEIQADGSGLRQVTSGPWDDFEPCYLPGGDIVFVSSRCKRWVSCWHTQVATMHRCDKDGGNIRTISANIEHDNTPAVMPDGRLLYTRWEYVDRSQVDFHHLWTANPDGTNVATWYGNMHPSIVMIDSKPVPGTNKVATVFSWGHGRTEHVGDLRLVTPDAGPDAKGAAEVVPGCPTSINDPFPVSPTIFLVARKNDLVLVDAKAGQHEVIYTDGQRLHEPALLRPRAKERVIPDRIDPTRSTGRLVLADITVGRNMEGVKPGEVKKLLVLETLPKPVNFSGGPEPLTWLGTFNLERVLGTVPVEPDGSAYLELPANRPLVFVALDEKDLSVKRMQSFVSVMPGETTGCVGCHEQRNTAPPARTDLLALRRPPARITPFAGIPDVIDFPRDVQPILDAACVKCHSYEKPDGGIVLTGDHGFMYSQSYWTLFASNQIKDGRNAFGNNPPRTIGSSASPLMNKIDGSHYDAKLDAKAWRTVWMWLESGATYSGTYAALKSGMVGVPVLHNPPGLQAVQRRCGSCHGEGEGKVPLVAKPSKPPKGQGLAPHERIVVDKDPMIRRSPHVLFNLTRPEKSIFLLAPLAKEAGGWGTCGKPAFKDTKDPDYHLFLGQIRAVAADLARIKRFDMPGFIPNEHYVREMKRYGILPADLDPARTPIDVFATDQRYWRSLWWEPTAGDEP